MSPSNELLYVSQQLIALAEATPAEKFAWRPGSGVRSTSEMYMHIVTANFGLLKVIGLDTPADLSENLEKAVTTKAEVTPWLKRSLDAVKTALAAATPEEMQRKVKTLNRMRPSSASFSASSFMRTSTGDNWSHTHE